MSGLEVVFWLSVLFVAYAYVGYPACVWLVARGRSRRVEAGDITPSVTFVIAARNEARRIRNKIENTLAQDYPVDRLEIIVASDCSEDATDGIVTSYADRGVRLVRSPERQGKEAAQQRAVAQSSGDVLVFSDVATVLAPDGIRRIVRSFHDESVGCVSSVDRLLERDGTPSGEGAYVRYEMWLRDLETRAGTVVGLSGSFFAARRAVCQEWPPDVPSDFHVLLNAVRRGQRGVTDRESVGHYPLIAREAHEFDRKVRTVLRGIGALMRNRAMLNPCRHGLFAWQLFSHKACRWLVPAAMATAFLANAALALGSRGYALALGAQAAFYVVGTWGLLRGQAPSRWLKLPTFFVMANLSIAAAWYRYLRGERMVTWTPSER